MKLKHILKSNIVFDFTNMVGEGRLTQEEIQVALDKDGARVAAAVDDIRSTGTAKNHLSKDGTPEHVFFPRMPYIAEGNPNTHESIVHLKAFAQKVRDFNEVVFLGIGGSYLGGRVLVDAIGGLGWNREGMERNGCPMVHFSGNNLDSEDCSQIISTIRANAQNHKTGIYKVMLVPMSKSGTTLETMAGFLYFYNCLYKSPNIELDCTVVTDLMVDAKDSPLLQVADYYHWDRFDIKEGIGGRFSVMTDPGLLPLAAIGGDVERFLRGARDMEEYCRAQAPEDNPALMNALLKYLAYTKGRDIEVFMPYCMSLKALSEWYIQLLSESLGKRFNRKGEVVNYGRTPIVAVGTTDMHSQTQQHQEGRLNKVIQFVEVGQMREEIVLRNPFPCVPFFAQYNGVNMHRALAIALNANEEALTGDNRYNARFTMPVLNEYYLGQIMYFLMLSVAYEGEFADVDAFDQPGVEIYKRIMKKHL